MTTGQRIKEARRLAGFTQKELGDMLGISFQAIAQWEAGKREPKIETLQRLGEALGVSWYWLIGKADFADAAQARNNFLEAQIAQKSGESIVKLLEARLGTYREITKTKPHADGYVSATYHLFGQGDEEVALLEEDFDIIGEAVIALVKSLADGMIVSKADAEEVCNEYLTERLQF